MNLTNLFRRGAKHADAVPDNSQEAMLRDAMQSAYVTPDISPDLRRRVAHLAMQHDQQRVMTPYRRSHLLWRYARRMACLAACMGVIVGIVAWPNIKTAYLLYRMQSALLNARSIHVLTWNTSKEITTLEWEVWRQEDAWRVETQNGKNIFVFLKTTKFRMSRGVSSLADKPVREPAGYQWAGGFLLTETPLQVAARALYSRLRKVETYNVNGRPTEVYSWQPSYYDRPHTYLWLDAQTHLPVEIKVDAEGKGGMWKLARAYTLNYDHPLSASAFISQ